MGQRHDAAAGGGCVLRLPQQRDPAAATSRVNRVNERREFFFATPAEVRTVLREKVGNLLEFTEQPEATQYLQSKKYWPN